MIHMQSNEVKAHLSDVLRKVEAGQKIAITRHGKVVAYLSPVPSPEGEAQRKAVIDQLLAFRRIKLADGESIAELRDEGRR